MIDSPYSWRLKTKEKKKKKKKQKKGDGRDVGWREGGRGSRGRFEVVV